MALPALLQQKGLQFVQFYYKVINGHSAQKNKFHEVPSKGTGHLRRNLKIAQEKGRYCVSHGKTNFFFFLADPKKAQWVLQTKVFKKHFRDGLLHPNPLFILMTMSLFDMRKIKHRRLINAQKGLNTGTLATNPFLSNGSHESCDFVFDGWITSCLIMSD